MKTAYAILPTLKADNGEFIPIIVKEGETGYYKTDWTWGKDIDEAEKFARAKNRAMGISDATAQRLVIASMHSIPAHS